MDGPDLAVIVTRPYNPETDAGFIYRYWRNNAFYSSADPIIQAMAKNGVQHENAMFFRSYTRSIKEILKHAHVKIACAYEDPQFLVGFSVFNPTHLYFVYVKADYRKAGIGAVLVPSTIKTFTDKLTKIGLAIVNKKNLITQGDPDHGITEDRQENEGMEREPAGVSHLH